jgi:hypothetical protein
LELPSNLIAGIAAEHSVERRAWAAALPRVVADLAQRWSLHVGRPFQPGGQCSWVAPVRDQGGQDLVLKVGWRHPEAVHEADGLALWAGTGLSPSAPPRRSATRARCCSSDAYRAPR